MIECQVIQGCEAGITERHNDNVDILRLFCFCFIVSKTSTQLHMCGGTLSIGPCTSQRQSRHECHHDCTATSNPIINSIQQVKLQCNATTCHVSLLP